MLALSKEYTAKCLNITVNDLCAIESGSRYPTDGEIKGFDRLYGINTKEYLAAADLTDTDDKAVQDLKIFKRSLEERKVGDKNKCRYYDKQS